MKAPLFYGNTINSCVACGGMLKDVKKQFDFTVEDIPFRTKQKYDRLTCVQCGEEYIHADVIKTMEHEFAAAKAELKAQDNMYAAYAIEGPMVPMKDYIKPEKILRESAKTWNKGAIHYLRYLNTGDGVKIVPAISTYEVYCLPENTMSVAARQFVKPEDYFKLTSVEVFNSNSRLSSVLPARNGDA